MTLTPRAMILAAGFGTRLESLTSASQADAPGVWTPARGVGPALVGVPRRPRRRDQPASPRRSDPLPRGWDGRAPGCRALLGGGGGDPRHGGRSLRARPHLDDGSSPVVVANGKIITDIDLEAALRTHVDGGYEATMVLREDREQVWKGGIQRARDGRLGALMGSGCPTVSSILGP